MSVSPAQGPARPGGQLGRDLPGRVHAEGLHPGRPHPPRLDRHARPEQPLARRGGAGLGHLRRFPRAGAVVAAPARRGGRIVELPAQVLHPALAGGLVGQHGLLLAGALGGHPLVAFRVVVPRLAGRGPAAADPAHRAVHVEHLEHGLEPAAGQVHVRLEHAGRQRPARLGQDGEGRADLPLRREGERGEVGPDVPVLPAGQQDHLGPGPRLAFKGPPGPADLLVVSDRRLRRAQVHDEAEVRLVEAHAERAGRPASWWWTRRTASPTWAMTSGPTSGGCARCSTPFRPAFPYWPPPRPRTPG